MNKEKLKKIQQKINEDIIKNPSVKKLLEIKNISEKTNELLRDKKSLDKSHYEDVYNFLVDLRELLSSVDRKEYPEVPAFPKEMSIDNWPKPQEINVEKVEFPENMKKLRNVDEEKIIKALTEIQLETSDAIIKQLEKVHIDNRNRDDAIPVRVVFEDKMGNRKFDPDYVGAINEPRFHTGWNDTDGNETKVQLDASGQVPVAETTPSTLVAFVTDIPTAGSRVQLASNSISAGVLQAPSTNTGNVFIGGSNVSSTVFGAELQPGQATGIAISNTNKIYIDAATNGDDVAFIGS